MRPSPLQLFYVAKIVAYVLVGWLIVLTTKGIDSFVDVTADARRGRRAQC